MSGLYHDIILDHYKNPRNVGELSDATVFAKDENTSCGDEVEIYLEVSNKKQVKMMKWKGRGCAISTAAASMLSEKVIEIGDTEKIVNITDHDMSEMLGGDISSARIKCATLALVALKKALSRS